MIDIKYMPKLWVLLLFGYFLLLMILDIHQAREFISNSLFDFIVHPLSGGSAGTLTLFLGIYPVLAILIPLIVDKMENDMVVIRIRNKKELFYQHFIFSIVISAIFVIVMVLAGGMASNLLTGSVKNLWPTEKGSIYFYLENKTSFPIYIPQLTSFKVWLYIISSRFLAILSIAVLLIFLKLVLKKNSYVLLVSLLFLLGSGGLFPGHFHLFLGYIDIDPKLWISPEHQLFTLVYHLFWIVLLFILCQWLYKKKEFYH
ncbi:hypothetical protein [Caldifermentibacillus hisashii]|uniref:hypothetical protein n=1 Tax=Caldifermentibacillus hisashii TaxID=996558 RepID=UPI0031B70E13